MAVSVDKDDLEHRLHRTVCRGDINLRDAQHMIASDCVASAKGVGTKRNDAESKHPLPLCVPTAAITRGARPRSMGDARTASAVSGVVAPTEVP